MSSRLADLNIMHEHALPPTPPPKGRSAIDARNEAAAKETDDRHIRFTATFNGTATPEQARRCFRDILGYCMHGQSPGHAAAYQTTRTFEIIGRQAVALEILRALYPSSPIPTTPEHADH